jgi:hypothetical protein
MDNHANAVEPPAGKAQMLRKALGLTLVVATAVVWVVASFVSEALVAPAASGARPAIPPFILTYLATSLFVVYLPVVHAKDAWQAVRQRSSKRQQGDADSRCAGLCRDTATAVIRQQASTGCTHRGSSRLLARPSALKRRLAHVQGSSAPAGRLPFYGRRAIAGLSPRRRAECCGSGVARCTVGVCRLPRRLC